MKKPKECPCPSCGVDLFKVPTEDLVMHHNCVTKPTPPAASWDPLPTLKMKLSQLYTAAMAFDERFKANPHHDQATHIRMRGIHDGAKAEAARRKGVDEAVASLIAACEEYTACDETDDYERVRCGYEGIVHALAALAKEIERMK